TNLVPGDTNGVADVFVRFLYSGIFDTTYRASVAYPSLAEGNGPSGLEGIAVWGSRDGASVSFTTDATNLSVAGFPGFPSGVPFVVNSFVDVHTGLNAAFGVSIGPVSNPSLLSPPSLFGPVGGNVCAGSVAQTTMDLYTDVNGVSDIYYPPVNT